MTKTGIKWYNENMNQQYSLGLDHSGYFQSIENFLDNSRQVYVLREDLLHPVVSGNKWRKLSGYLDSVRQKGKRGLLTFGGPFSNHILATAFACQKHNLQSVGIIRGMDADFENPTLRRAQQLGMNLLPIPRENYKNGIDDFLVASIIDTYSELEVVPEGGKGMLGTQGFMQVGQRLDHLFHTDYRKNHMICAMGTGTTFVGLTLHCDASSTRVYGVPILRHDMIDQDVEQTFGIPIVHNSILKGYERGGYARSDDSLIAFMNDLYARHRIPTDFIYTAKLFMAVEALIKSHYFDQKDRIIIYHSGGLQGNAAIKHRLDF